MLDYVHLQSPLLNDNFFHLIAVFYLAKHLKESAQMIMENFDGNFPQDYDDILSLKGIGSYTAGAISSISYHKAVPAVDGNVLRIIARYNEIEDNIY